MASRFQVGRPQGIQLPRSEASPQHPHVIPSNVGWDRRVPGMTEFVVDSGASLQQPYVIPSGASLRAQSRDLGLGTLVQHPPIAPL